MPTPTIVSAPGAWNANSYESVAEVDVFFDSRFPLDTPWGEGDVAKETLLVMATRSLDASFRGYKILVLAQGSRDSYYIVRRKWTGVPATTTQKLAWPRLGMKDQNGNVLDFDITGISAAAAAVVTTAVPHRRTSGDTVLLANTNCTPSLDGARVVTVLSTTTFSVPVITSVAGTLGTMTFLPQDLKDALSEFAGQLSLADRTLDSDVTVQGITSARAGSVAVTFKDEYIDPKLLPQAVIDLIPPSWYTEETIEQTHDFMFSIQ